MPKPLTGKLFTSILQMAEDITDRFDVDLGGIPQDVVASRREADPHIQNIREILEEQRLRPDAGLTTISSGLINMAEWTIAHGSKVQEAYRAGNVVAIDATPLVPMQRFLTAQVYACAIGTLTYKEQLQLKAQVVKTKAPQQLLQDRESTIQYIEDTDRQTSTQSWPSAFMEYRERQAAYEHPARYALIDGPIITQNLITQEEGRTLYKRMLGLNRKCYVGITKDLRFADSEERFVAAAVRTGELCIRNTELNVMLPRIERDYGGTIKRFAEDYLGNVFRGIYKPGRKAFGFQCHRHDLPAVVALLSLDCHTQPGHEIPFLLEMVDSMIRGRYRPAETAHAIEAALARNDIDEFYDEAEERSFR
jgi:hypothetical protein